VQLGIATIAVIIGAAGAWIGPAALATGTGYTAMQLCSGVFVSGLEPATVLAGIAVDDVKYLKYVGTSVNQNARAVTASIIGFKRRAVYREGLGCTLVLGGRTPPAWPAGVTGDTSASHSWAMDTGTARGPLHAVVARAFEETDPERLRRTLAVVVVQGGRIIAEKYAPGIGPQTRLPGWSMTKSVNNALVGILVGAGRLTVAAPAPVPEWQMRGDGRSAITLDQLLHMTSGLRFDEGYANPRSDVLRMLYGAPSMAAYAAKLKLDTVPGTRYRYSSGTTNIVARVIRNVMKDETEYLTFPRRALFDRIRMTSAVLETDAAGTFAGSSYLFATTRDWARFGLLYLHDGVWNGQRILPNGWVAYSTARNPLDPDGRYAAGFWRQVPPSYAPTDGQLPADAYHAIGHEAQLITIIPSRDIVIVRLGRTRYFGRWDHPAFVRDVLGAIEN
jgi:CubicO group peptidase (beta-lactamase class C family)